MSVSKEQVRDLLGTGLSVSVVASAVGCNDSYISQLLADESFAAEVSRLRLVALQSHNKRDSSIDEIEDALLGKLNDAVSQNAFYKPKDLLHAFAVINNAKRRGSTPADTAAPAGATVINLTIPATVARRFTIDSRGEVLQVDEQTLVTMPTGQLLRELQHKTGDSRYKEVKNRLMTAEVVGEIKNEE
jgi:hypothetical protein